MTYKSTLCYIDDSFMIKYLNRSPTFIEIQENYFKFEKIFIFKYKGISVRVKRQLVRT